MTQSHAPFWKEKSINIIDQCIFSFPYVWFLLEENYYLGFEWKSGSSVADLADQNFVWMVKVDKKWFRSLYKYEIIIFIIKKNYFKNTLYMKNNLSKYKYFSKNNKN